MQVAAAGVCGSELSAYLGHNELRQPPLIMGHEFSGTITAVGRSEDADWIGRLVTSNPLISCGTCRWCREGLRQLCQTRRIIGIDFAGAFAETVLVPLHNCTPVDDAVTGSLVEPLACAYRAVHLANVKSGDTAVVYGAGIIGLMCARLLAQRGCQEVLVLDENPYRLAHAPVWGATHSVQPRDLDVTEYVHTTEGADLVVDAVGASKTREQALALVRRGGSVVWIGLHEETSLLAANRIVRNEIAVRGSFCYTDDDFARATDYANAGRLPRDGKWFEVRPLQEGAQAFRELARGDSSLSKIILTI